MPTKSGPNDTATRWIESLKALARALIMDEPAEFEIRNVHTGRLAPGSPTFQDGTLADRTARQLGPDWRVFRCE